MYAARCHSWVLCLTRLGWVAGCAQGSARVIRCLQDAREELTYECRATLFDAEVRMAEDIDFKYPMKRSCTAEIQAFCPRIEHGHARVRLSPTPSFCNPGQSPRPLAMCTCWRCVSWCLLHAACRLMQQGVVKTL